MAVFDFIEAFYNPHRRHSALGYLSSANYEWRHQLYSADPSQEPSTKVG